VREVAEETGLEIEDVKFLTAVETMFAAEGKHYVTIFMTAVAKVDADGNIPDPQVGLSRRLRYDTLQC
jgi:8-oxo-dGTP diphosphatase